ncbi:MAG: peptidylprolyl isomerase [Phycisphaerae bacterium]|nr:peptidylprolyl isomerase [Phycisphaerae bacterium]
MPNTSTNPRVELEITCHGDDWGRVVLELDAEKTPQTVQNFLAYVDDGFYDGTVFHRVIPTFMIQGGGYGPDYRPVRKGLRKPVQNEAASGGSNVRGAIAMARTDDPHSATSQFFISVTDNPFLDYPGHDGWGYCVFGRVTEGMDVVDRIKDVKTQNNPAMGEASQPIEAPVIKSARRL